MNDRYHYLIIIVLTLFSFSAYLSALINFANLKDNEILPSEWFLAFAILFAITSFTVIIIFVLIYTKRFDTGYEGSKNIVYMYLLFTFIFSFTIFILAVVDQHSNHVSKSVKNLYIAFSALGTGLTLVFFFYFYYKTSVTYNKNKVLGNIDK